MLQQADISQSAADLRAAFGYRSRGLSDGKKTRSYPNGDPTDSRRDRGCKAHGIGAVEARQSSPQVDTPNYAKPSCHGEETLAQDAAQHAARLRAGSSNFLTASRRSFCLRRHP